MGRKRSKNGRAYRPMSNNKSNQCNPNNRKYRGHKSGYSGRGTKSDLDNHSNQLNPNNWRFKGPKNRNDSDEGCCCIVM